MTDPPFFDNVRYSELADFFFAWQQLLRREQKSTRHVAEVQDSNADHFAIKLRAVLRECHRILKEDGLLVFTYRHSRDEGWKALAEAVLGAGFLVVNSHPVKSEMTVATPKSHAKEPIQLDTILVCRKTTIASKHRTIPADKTLTGVQAKLRRLQAAGLDLSRNDRKVVLFGQLLTAVDSVERARDITARVDGQLANLEMDVLPLFRTL